jgi:hypothetical protein
MRILSLAALVSLAAVAIAPAAGAQGVYVAGRQMIVCMKPDGSTFAPQCTDQRHRAMMTCGCGSASHVTLPICGVHETPAPETTEALRARYAAAAHGDVTHATYQGKRFCVGHTVVPATAATINGGGNAFMGIATQ